MQVCTLFFVLDRTCSKALSACASACSEQASTSSGWWKIKPTTSNGSYILQSITAF